MATIGQQLTAPESGWKRYDDSDSAFKYVGEWLTNSTIASSQYKSTLHHIAGSQGNIEYSFEGTKIRLIAPVGAAEHRSDKISIEIDGVEEFFSIQNSVEVYQMLVYEKLNLSMGRHTVKIKDAKTGTSSIYFDAIDIDSTGRLLHPNEVTDIKNLDIGKRIRCHYQALSDAVGTFSGLGQETSGFIPVASSATPNGDFYWIMVEDWNKQKILIADRNIQHSVSWNTLNAAGIASGSGVIITNTVIGDAHTQTSISDLGVTIADTDDGADASFKAARVSNGVKTGKWYFEATAISFTTTANRGYRGIVGVIDKGTIISSVNGRNDEEFISSVNKVAGYSYSGNILPSNVPSGANTTAVGDTIGIALNLDDGKITYYKNGMLLIETTIDNSVEWYPFHVSKWLSKTTFNFGDRKFKYNIPSGFKAYDSSSNIMTIRLMNGGVSASDKDNEWDKYIVDSTLNGTIIAGNNNVWNWSGSTYSLTSTSSSSDTRVVRGGGTANAWAYGISGTVSNQLGFRPVLEIYTSFTTKSLFIINGEYKTWIEEIPGEEELFTNNVIPTMTSNTTPKGIASASSIFSSVYDAWYAFDKVDLNTSCWSSTATTGWLAYDFGVPTVISKYEISPNNYTNAATTSPRDWTFEGWDGQKWNVLNTQVGVTGWVAGVKKQFSFYNITPYNKYRINISASNGDLVAISEFGMCSYIPGKPATPSSWNTVSATLPSVDTFINEGMNDLSMFDRKPKIFNIPMDDNSTSGEALGSGRVFKEKIDLKKYFEITNVKVK